MKKIGIFLDEIKDQSIEIAEKFQKMSSNTGNLLFWNSLKIALNLDVKSLWYTEHPEELNLAEYKAFITTDLIWIRQEVDFSYLNNVLDIIGDLPLIPISIGLQSKNFDPDFRLHPETVKVLKRISERCVMGVRGYYTAEILAKYRISNFKVIGCPSMYMPGVNFTALRKDSKKPEKITANSETFYGRLNKHKTDFLIYCAENNFDFVEQTEYQLNEGNIPESEKLSKIKGWLDAQGNCFFDIEEWREYMRGYDFSIGMRFHGNVIALWEGVPALFIICDSRTKELCEFYSLPNIDIEEFDPEKPAEYYYGLANYTKFSEKYPENFEKWRSFLDMNGIGDARTEYKSASHNRLYYCKTARQLLVAVIYAMKAPGDALNVLMISPFLNDLFTNLTNISFNNKKVFDKVIVFRADKITPKTTCDNNVFIDDIERYYDRLLLDNDVVLSRIDKVIVFAALRFSIYLIKKQKNFDLYEDSSGCAGSLGMVQWLDHENVDKKALAYNLGISCGSSKYISVCYIDKSASNYGEAAKKIPENKIVDFSLSSFLNSLTDAEYAAAINFFSVKSNFEDIKYDYVILTQYYGIKSELKRELYFALIADVFTSRESKVLIKAHPADNTDYSGHFPYAVNNAMPFELLDKKLRYKKIIILSSSAQADPEKKIVLGNEFQDFHFLCFYSLFLLLEHIFVDVREIEYNGKYFKNVRQMASERFDGYCLNPTGQAARDVILYDKMDDFITSSAQACKFEMTFSDKMDSCAYRDDVHCYEVCANADSENILHGYVYVRIHDRNDLPELLGGFEEKLTYSGAVIGVREISKVLLLKQEVDRLNLQNETLAEQLEKQQSELDLIKQLLMKG